MGTTAHTRLEQGAFRYHRDPCPDCSRPPAAKLFVDDDNQVRSVVRTAFCNRKPVDFSIGLMVWSGPRKSFTYAIRACSAHANYHVHWWHKLRQSEVRVTSLFLLMDQDDVIRAHRDAAFNVLSRYEEWRDKWNAKK